MARLLVVVFVPLLLSFLAMPRLCRFLRVTLMPRCSYVHHPFLPPIHPFSAFSDTYLQVSAGLQITGLRRWKRAAMFTTRSGCSGLPHNRGAHTFTFSYRPPSNHARGWLTDFQRLQNRTQL